MKGVLTLPQCRSDRLRILVVDHDPDSARATAILLHLWGHDTRVASSGKAALAEARAYVPNVVLLDLALPDIHGYEVAERIMKRAADELPLIAAVTGYAREEWAERLRIIGVPYCLQTPVEPSQLRWLLQHWCSPRRRRSG